MTEERIEVDTKSGIIAWWAGNSVAANLLMIAIIALGVFGYLRMDREVFPTAGFNGLTISVTWPGASPQDIEDQIVLRMEEAVSGLEGIRQLNSTAREGSAFINIEADRSVDMTEFLNEVKLRVDSVNNLPPESFRPVVRQWESQEQVMGLVLYGEVDRVALKRLADTIRDEVAKLPGAERASVDGTLEEEVAIEVSEDALRRFGISFQEVARAVRAGSVNASAGSVQTDTGSVTLTARQLADNAAEFENIIIRQTVDGGIVRVGDVATVRDGLQDVDFYSTFNGKPMAMITISSLRDGNNVLATKAALQDYIEKKKDELPPGVTFDFWWDSSEIFESRINTVASSALFGGALVFITLFLFLRPIVAFWVSFGVFVAFAGTFAILPFMGVSLNMLSTFAFLIVIGIVVDDAIIVGENIHNQVEKGYRGLDAAVLGTQLVAKPIMFAVITTMMAFAPWMMLTGPEVQFTRQISFVVIAALSFSLIESFLILPNHLAHMKPISEVRGFFGGFIRFQQGFANLLVWFARNIYRPTGHLAIQYRYITLSIFIASFILTVFGAWLVGGLVKFSFMPEVENEAINMRIEMPEGTPFTRIEQVIVQVEAGLDQFRNSMNREYDGAEVIEAVSAFAWGNNVQSWITVKKPEERPEGLSMKMIAERLQGYIGTIPDAEEFELNYTISENEDGVRFALQSRDLDALRLAAEDLKTKLSTFEDVFEVRDSLTAAADEARITLKPGAQGLGLTLTDVTSQVGAAFYGVEAQRLPRQGSDVRVMVRYPREARDSLDSLQSLRIRTADGREVPLQAVADIEFAPGMDRIQRRNRERAAYVIGETRGDAATEIRKDLDENFFPEFDRRHPLVTREAVGDAQGQEEFNQEIGGLTLMMLIAMFALLAIAFRSIFQPVLVMTAIPFGLVGAIIGHLIMDVPMALFSFFGIGAAAGVVINDNLVLLDYVNRLREKGFGAMHALVEAGTVRFRPILLTSVTTFLGILPMMAEASTQAQFLKPMVVSLGFAVVFALFLTLFLVPALYAIGTDVSRFLKWVFLGRELKFIGSGYDDKAVLAHIDDGDWAGGH
jgi:multidrug efflux pump subunit AcrB